MKSPCRGNKGMTLVEIVIVVALALMVMLAVIATSARNAVFSRRIDMIYTSSNLAKKRMDDIKRMNFRDLDERAEEMDVRVDENGEADANGFYIRTTEIAPNVGGNPYLTRVKVSVDKMVEGAPSGNAVVFETLFSDVQ